MQKRRAAWADLDLSFSWKRQVTWEPDRAVACTATQIFKSTLPAEMDAPCLRVAQASHFDSRGESHLMEPFPENGKRHTEGKITESSTLPCFPLSEWQGLYKPPQIRSEWVTTLAKLLWVEVCKQLNWVCKMQVAPCRNRSISKSPFQKGQTKEVLYTDTWNRSVVDLSDA